METVDNASVQARVSGESSFLSTESFSNIEEAQRRSTFRINRLSFGGRRSGKMNLGKKLIAFPETFRRNRVPLFRPRSSPGFGTQCLSVLRGCLTDCCGDHNSEESQEDSDSTPFGTPVLHNQNNTPVRQEIRNVRPSSLSGNLSGQSSSGSQVMTPKSSDQYLPESQHDSTIPTGYTHVLLQSTRARLNVSPSMTALEANDEIRSSHCNSGHEQNDLAEAPDVPFPDSQQEAKYENEKLQDIILALREQHNQQLLELEVKQETLLAEKEADFARQMKIVSELEEKAGELEEAVRRTENQKEEEELERREELKEERERIERLQAYILELNEERVVTESEKEKDWEIDTLERISLRMSTRLYKEELTLYSEWCEDEEHQSTPSATAHSSSGDMGNRGKQNQTTLDLKEEKANSNGYSPPKGNDAGANESLESGEIREDTSSQASMPLFTTVWKPAPTVPTPLTGFEVGCRYRIGGRIGSGGQVEVFEGTDLQLQESVVIKAETRTTMGGSSLTLRHENEIYRLLKTDEAPKLGIPRVHYYEEDKHHNFLVMDRFGRSLNQLFPERLGQITDNAAFEIGIILVLQLKHIHARGIVHGDLSPANIAFGRDTWTIHIINYERSARYLHEGTSDHVFNLQRNTFNGTNRYASRHAHEKNSLSRRDDLESLGYILVELLRGSLPWEGNNWREIGEQKNSCRSEELCDGLPTQLLEFLEYVKGLTFSQEPDYTRMCVILESALKRHDGC